MKIYELELNNEQIKVFLEIINNKIEQRWDDEYERGYKSDGEGIDLEDKNNGISLFNQLDQIKNELTWDIQHDVTLVRLNSDLSGLAEGLAGVGDGGYSKHIGAASLSPGTRVLQNQPYAYGYVSAHETC